MEGENLAARVINPKEARRNIDTLMFQQPQQSVNKRRVCPG
jgi:hypothetical protein